MTRNCEMCGVPLVRRDNEPTTEWASRKTCSNACRSRRHTKIYREAALENYKVDPTTGCWIFLGVRRNKLGYGSVGGGKTRIRASLLFYEAHRGPLPAGQLLRHRCDNPPCVNPDHLLPGTHVDNKHDAMERDRHARGSRSKMSNLTEADIPIIRSSVGTGEDIGRKYGVSGVMINKIRRREAWTHVL